MGNELAIFVAAGVFYIFVWMKDDLGSKGACTVYITLFLILGVVLNLPVLGLIALGACIWPFYGAFFYHDYEPTLADKIKAEQIHASYEQAQLRDAYTKEVDNTLRR